MRNRMENVIVRIVFMSIAGILTHIQGQHNFYNEHKAQELTWCTISQEEFYKCENFTRALERDRTLFDDDYAHLSCKMAFNTEECVKLIDAEKAHVMSLDAGEVFVAGRYHSLIPIMQESFDGGFKNYFAVAVVKTGTLPEVTSLRDLRGKKACFSEVGSLAGWIIPIYTLQREGGMEIIDCNNHVKSATNYFGISCAVNSLINKYNPIGDNSDKLCQLCTAKVLGQKCTAKDPYSGFEGAFRCLVEAGDIAFLKHTTVVEMLESKQFKTSSGDGFELLCKDGSRRPLSEYQSCQWGIVPSHAIVTSSARTTIEIKSYQNFLKKAVEIYSKYQNATSNRQQNDYEDFNRNRNQSPSDRFNNDRNPYDRSPYGSGTTTTTTTTERNYPNRFDNQTQMFEDFDIFRSEKYGGRLNLLIQDAARNLEPIAEVDRTYVRYLGESAMEKILGVRQCPVGRMSLCITSDAEMEKCVKMRTALKAQLIKPDMVCHKAHSHITCMQAIQSGNADVVMLDASDVYTAGLRHDLIPFMSEVYNLGEPEYYVVAVAKEEDPDTELTYLKGKKTCHMGMFTAAGWVYPLAYLISNGWIRPYGCDSIRAAAEYFSKSCVPGALSSEYNTGVPYDNLCDLCHGASFRYCRRDASEPYYGHSGAFRCLVEGGGHVAFVKHTTVAENTGGKRREWWSRNTLTDEFELLCPDGTRAEMTDYKRCNLGKVKANAFVTRGSHGYNETQIKAYINLLQYAQQFYGRKDADDFSFSMFYSPPPNHDLIFQDATRQLRIIPPEQREYSTYLGKDFMRARRITDCNSGANERSTLSASHIVLSIVFACLILHNHVGEF